MQRQNMGEDGGVATEEEAETEEDKRVEGVEVAMAKVAMPFSEGTLRCLAFTVPVSSRLRMALAICLLLQICWRVIFTNLRFFVRERVMTCGE
jgi:hypothetical protein